MTTDRIRHSPNLLKSSITKLEKTYKELSPANTLKIDELRDAQRKLEEERMEAANAAERADNLGKL